MNDGKAKPKTPSKFAKGAARYNKFGRKTELAQFYYDRFWRSQLETTLTVYVDKADTSSLSSKSIICSASV